MPKMQSGNGKKQARRLCMPNLQRSFRFETRQHLWHNIKAVIYQHNQRPFRLSAYARAEADELN
jgi:hypothetical protein